MTTNLKADGNTARDNATQIINATYNQSWQTPINICLSKSNWPNPDFIKTDITAIDGVLDESIELIFRNNRFKKWCEEQHTTLLWIVGSAGKGKSTMTVGIVNEMKKPSTISETSNTRATVGYFFCRSSIENTNTAVDILKGLICSLSNDSAQLGQYLYRHWNEREQAFDSNVERLESLWQILRNMLSHPAQSLTYIIIDGLDECDETVGELLSLIGTDGLVISRPVKWLLASRPLQIRLQQFIPDGPRQHQIVLDEHPSELKDAIGRYVAVKVRKTALSDYDEFELGKIRSLLTNNAEETFLWVSLVCREIANLPAKQAVNIISTVPRKLFALYDRGMQKICDGCQRGDEQSLRCWQLIWTRHSLYNDPHIIELAKLAGIHGYEDYGEPYLKELVSACNGFLLLTDNKSVRLIHTSAKDYLDHIRTQSSYLSIGIPNHELITERCFVVLNQKLCKNISRLGWVDSAAADVQAAVKEDVRSQIGYSCTHWAKHLSVAGISLTLSNTMQHFLFTHFLHWIEALCVLERLFDCMIVLETTISLLKSSNWSELLNFVTGARNFVQLNSSRLERWPLQIYSSALIFSPQQGFIVRYLADHIPPWVVRSSKNNMLPQDLPLWTIEVDSERIFNMAYSPSGNILVTQSANAIRLWRPEGSSKSIILLGETDRLRDAAGTSTTYWSFMEDETKIQAAIVWEGSSPSYWTGTWNTITGDVLKRMTKHKHQRRRRRNHMPSYSENLRWLASFNGQVPEPILEDIAGSNTRITFPVEPTLQNPRISFSPNDEYMATVYDFSIHIWSITSRRHVRLSVKCWESCSLPFISSTSYSVQFSRDSERLICYARCRIGLYVWTYDVSQVLLLDGAVFDHVSSTCTIDVRPRQYIIRIPDAQDWVFSPDGKYIAALTQEGIYVIKTGSGIIRIIYGRFEAITFMPEHLRFASSDLLGTIQVWAVRTNGHFPRDHNTELNTMPVLTSAEKKAPLASYIESGSLDWIGLPPKYEFIIPSPDNRFVCLSASWSGMHLLDILSGESSQIPLSSFEVEQFNFSPDSQWFATSSKGADNGPSVIQVWSTSIARSSRSLPHDYISVVKRRHVFLGMRDLLVQAMTFSRDSSLLYCSYATITGLFPRIAMDVFNLQNGELRIIKGPLCIHEYNHDRGVACVSSDNSLVASTLGQKRGMVKVVILQDSGPRPSVLSTKPSPLAVKAMLFSPSGNMLAVHRDEGKSEIYSTSSLTKGLLSRVRAKRTNPVAQFDGLETLAHFEFTGDSQQIRTNCGTIHIRDDHISRSPDSCLQELSFDGQWVCLGTQKILWLPPDCRPLDRFQSMSSKFLGVCFSNNWIWFVNSNNRITAIEFDLGLVKELVREGRFV